MSNNYGEILCQATEILAKNLINQVTYDRTILCSIIDDKEKEFGKYKVQNSEAIFDAYTSDTSFKKGNQVYVSVPMGNWDEQKLIIAKKMNDINQPITYQDPYESFVNITNNLVQSSLNSQGLIANDSVKKQILLWSYNKENSDALIKSSGEFFNGYTRLGISANFQTWLKELGVIYGDYGLNLIIEIESEDSEDIKNDNKDNEDFEGISPSIKVCSLNCSDMIGNPYNYESFYAQKKVFDISSLKNIKSMELWFFQKEGSFINQEFKAIEPSKTPNIFVKDISISMGYDANSFEEDTLIIYTMDSVKYDVKKTPAESNHKKLFARWIHKFENGNVKVVNSEDDINYNLTWYRYEQGARSHTAWSGVDWAPLSSQIAKDKNIAYEILDNDWNEYNELSSTLTDTPIRKLSYNQSWLLPDTTRSEEKVKALIEYDGNIIESTIINFSNVSEVVNKATVDAIQALSINCEDDSFGNYLIYNLGGQIIDKAESQKVRNFKAYFNSAADDIDDNLMAELVEAESIEWIIPAENTMIEVKDFISRVEDLNPIDGYYHIFRFSDELGNIRNQNSQRYKIKSHYTHSYSNNTIKCIVTKNKIKYTAVKELTFGPAGTSGTDYTFILDFNDGVNALTLKSDYDENETIPKTIVQARLYDYTGKEIPNLETKNIQWSLSEKELDNEDANDNILENNFFKIIPQKEKNKVEIQLKDSVTSVPNNNFTVLKAVLKASKQAGDTGWGDYDLYAYLPIPIRSSRKYQFISGTTTIFYNSLGYLDNYFQNPYCLYYMNEDTGSSVLESRFGTWQTYSAIANDPYRPKEYQNSQGQWYIRPINIYVEDTMKEICSVGKDNGKNVWSQPLFITQNKYPSSIINKWNGELTIDNDENAILAAKIAAGKKHDDNTFSGVMMGDWKGNDTSSTEGAITENTGIYGFQQGVASFGFRDDGTAFIGKPGAGRLEFNGNKSIIQSNSMANNSGGLLLDFDDGLIKMINPTNDPKKGTILLNAGATTSEPPFKIGDKFSVNWDGTMTATDGNFTGDITGGTITIGNNFSVDSSGNMVASNGKFTGTINSESGTIGGWKIGKTTLEGTINGKSSGIILDAENAAICGGKLKPLGSERMKVCGSLEICDANGNSVTENGINHIGRVASGLPDANGNVSGTPGIGLSVEGYAALKVTEENIGLQYSNGGGYISISKGVIGMGTGGYFNISGSNITLNDKKFKISNIPAADQEGIYARFA